MVDALRVCDVQCWISADFGTDGVYMIKKTFIKETRLKCCTELGTYYASITITAQPVLACCFRSFVATYTPCIFGPLLCKTYDVLIL